MNETTLLSIKEFSKFTGTAQSTLRYYDEIGLLPPAERGENNYRYYVPFQIILLNFINVLADLGVPLLTIKDMLKNRTPESIIELLNRQEAKLDHQLFQIRSSYATIHTFRRNITNGLMAHDNDIFVQEMDEANLVLGPLNDFSGTDSFYEPFIHFCNSANKYRINLRYPIGAYHDNIQSFVKAPGQPNRFFSQDPLGNFKRAEGSYLTGYKRGYYGEFEDFADKMVSYAKEHSLSFHGPVYTLYLLDEISIVQKEKYLVRLSIRVLPKKRGGSL